MSPPRWLVSCSSHYGASAENRASHHFQAGRSARTSRADPPSQAHHLSEQVSVEVITLFTFTAPQLMDCAYIDWLETLPCRRKPQKVNQWMGGWGAAGRHYLKRLICPTTRLCMIARISEIPCEDCSTSEQSTPLCTVRR